MHNFRLRTAVPPMAATSVPWQSTRLEALFEAGAGRGSFGGKYGASFNRNPGLFFC